MKTPCGQFLDNRRLIDASESVCCIVAFLMLLSTNPANAGEEGVSARNPTVWTNAALNTVVLQYTYSGRDAKRYTETGNRLSVLIHRNLLYSVIKYSPVGGTQILLNGNEEENRPDVILDKILGERPGADDVIQPGHAIIYMWGRIYEDGEDVYVQSYMRFLRRGVNERLTWKIDDGSQINVKLEGSFPVQAISFAPRKLSKSTLENIDRAFEKNGVLRQVPDENAPGRPIAPDFKRGDAYEILEARNEWMKIKNYRTKEEGWVKTGVDMGKNDIRFFLPELYFAEAAAGYLRQMMAYDDPKVSNVNQAAIMQAIEKFEQAGKRIHLQDMSLALAHIMRAELNHRSGNKSPVEVAQLLDNAADMVPRNADAVNLSVCGQVFKEYKTGWKDSLWRSWNSHLMDALSLAPGNYSVLKNLESFYRMASVFGAEAVGLSGAELVTKIEQVAKIRSVAEKRRGEK